MNPNGNLSTLDADADIEANVIPSDQKSVIAHNAFLERLREIHTMVIYLEYLYATRVTPARDEYERLQGEVRQWVTDENECRHGLRKDINEEIRSLREQREALQSEFDETEQRFYEQACAESQLRGSLVPLSKIGSKSDEHERVPAERWRQLLSLLSRWVSRMIPYVGPPAALLCGTVLGLCFGTLFGIFSLTDLQRGDRLAFAGFAVLVGMTIVFLLGKLMEYTVQIYADRVGPGANGPWLPCILTGGLLLLFTLAEVALEGYGLREVHRDYLESLRRMSGDEGAISLLPTYVYFLLGILVSGPYLGCKLGAAWLRPRSEAPAPASADQNGGLFSIEGQAETPRRLVALDVKCRQLRERREEIDRRLGALEEELKTLAPVDTPPERLIEQLRAAEAAYRTERAHYERILAQLVYPSAPGAEDQVKPT